MQKNGGSSSKRDVSWAVQNFDLLSDEGGISVNDAKRIGNVSHATIYRMKKDGRLVFRKIGERKVVVIVGSLRALMRGPG